MSDTCRTRVVHVSRVWDHDDRVPGEILTCLHVRHLSVAHLEPELGFTPTKKKRGALKKNKGFFQKSKVTLFSKYDLSDSKTGLRLANWADLGGCHWCHF